MSDDERIPSVGPLPAGFDDWKTRAPDVPNAGATMRPTPEWCYCLECRGRKPRPKTLDERLRHLGIAGSR